MTESIAPTTYRRYILGKQGLWPGRRWSGKDGVAQALREVEAVQIDPVSVVAQSHDIVLWGRVAGYQPEYLYQVMYEDRQFFDYGGALMIFPMDELPYWRVAMERRKSEDRWAAFATANPDVIKAVKQELRQRGPLRNREIAGKSVNSYRASKDTGVALYYLWLTGELMTHHRVGKERVYDFLENVAPTELQHTAAMPAADDFFARKAIANLGLSNVRSFRNAWKGDIGRPVDQKEAQAKLNELEEAGVIRATQIEGEKGPFYFLASDMAHMAVLQDGQVPEAWQPVDTTTEDEVIFFSPLEYVSARGRAKKLFDFYYIWEIYKPAVKRKYGPYTLPILYDDRLVGRIDMKLDRPNAVLLVNGFWLEDWFAPSDAFAEALRQAMHRFMRFVGAEQLDVGATQPELIRKLNV